MKVQDIDEMIALLKRDDIDGYRNNAAKVRLGRLSVAYLKHVAKLLGLPREDFEVSFNPAGPAMPGDTWLQSTRFAISLSPNVNRPADLGVLFRRCERVELEPLAKGKLRYTWSTRYPNRWTSYDTLRDPQAFANKVRTCGEDKADSYGWTTL